MDNFTVASCVTTCIVIFTILSIIIKLGQWRRLYKQASPFPGPRTIPFIGNAHLFAGSSEDIVEVFLRLGKLYPTPYRLWIGKHLLCVINTPKLLKVVLHSPKTIDKGELFDFIRPWLGAGLLTATASKWQVHRKLIQPAFSLTILQSFVGVFSARSVITAEGMERNLGGPEFDIYKFTSQFALHAVCETIMGVKLETQSNDNGCYAETLKKLIASGCKRVVSPWLHPNCIFHRTQLGRNQQKYIKFLHDFTNNVIQTKKRELLEQNCRSAIADNEEDTESWIPRRKALLDHLLEISRDSDILSDEELREEIDTIMVTGSDTTAITISYVMLMLASHPEIQEKVYRELREIYDEEHDSYDLLVTPEHLNRMTYLERVIKETLRLFPLGPILSRFVTEDLDIGEHTFPAGSLLILSILELHRNEDIWPDPLKFDPDRFLPEEVKKREPYTYLPFSDGPRNCIGMKYAMMSMKTLLSTILRRYVLKKDNITPVKDIRIEWEFLLRPADPITLRIEKRT